MRELVIELEVDYYKPVKDERFEGYKLIWYKVILRAIYDYVLYKDSDDVESWGEDLLGKIGIEDLGK